MQRFKDRNPALQAEKKVDKASLNNADGSHEIILSVLSADMG
jgi:hypothetical protein